MEYSENFFRVPRTPILKRDSSVSGHCSVTGRLALMALGKVRFVVCNFREFDILQFTRPVRVSLPKGQMMPFEEVTRK